MEYVMHGKLLQHLRDQRSRQTSFFQFSDSDPDQDSNSSLTAKDLTKYAYGVAKGMEYVVSKGVSRKKTEQKLPVVVKVTTPCINTKHKE